VTWPGIPRNDGAARLFDKRMPPDTVFANRTEQASDRVKRPPHAGQRRGRPVRRRGPCS